MSERRRATFVALLALTSCELIANLDGDRSLVAASVGGSDDTGPTDLGGAGGEAGVGNGGGGVAGTATGGTTGGATGGTGTDGGDGGNDGGEAGTGGASGMAGVAGVAGTAGSAGMAATGGTGGKPPVGIPLMTPSCTGLVTDGCAGVDPCTAHLVPAGHFDMGRANEGSDAFASGLPHEQPAHRVSVGPYSLDDHEVTVARFRRFVENYPGPPGQDMGAHPRILSSGWQSQWNNRIPANGADLRAQLAVGQYMGTWREVPGSGDCRPMNWVDWYLAFAFCIWDEGRLPSEAEWEYAAAGADEERLFPWGAATPDSTHVVFNCSSGTPDCTSEDLPHVGSASPFGDGRFGHADLAGSLGEFVRDMYAVDFYDLRHENPDAEIINLGYDIMAQEVAVRGGSYSDNGAYMRAASRVRGMRVARTDKTGFRCARDP